MPIYKGARKGVTLDFTRINTSRDTPEKYQQSYIFIRGHAGQKLGDHEAMGSYKNRLCYIYMSCIPSTGFLDHQATHQPSGSLNDQIHRLVAMNNMGFPWARVQSVKSV